LNTDNVPNNGSLIRSYMIEHANTAAAAAAAANDTDDTTTTTTMKDFLDQEVVFCDTMVDRITSQRPGSGGMVPQCEPLPAKALVIFDEFGAVPSCLLSNTTTTTTTITTTSSSSSSSSTNGVVIRSTRAALELDVALKLRIANGTHTAIAHALALLGLLNTNVLSKTGADDDNDNNDNDNDNNGAVFMNYLDALVEEQIMSVYYKTNTTNDNNNDNNNDNDNDNLEEARRVWDDWRRRLMHPHFGLSSFFITQNGTAKGGIRWGPTVVDICMASRGNETPPQVALALAYAILLRWLTPLPNNDNNSSSSSSSNSKNTNTNTNGIYRGWLDSVDPTTVPAAPNTDDDDDNDSTNVLEYADGLRYDLIHGWYEFKCPLPALVTQLQACAASPSSSQQPSDCIQAVQTYLLSPDGGNLVDIAETPAFTDLVNAIAVLYARLIAGDGLLGLMKELDNQGGGEGAGKGGGAIGFTTPCSALSVVSPSSLITPVRGPRVLHYRPCSIPDNSRLLSLPVISHSLASVVMEEVQSVVAVDLHTHLMPPTHGPLCLWGIDELLTYVSRNEWPSLLACLLCGLSTNGMGMPGYIIWCVCLFVI
jgi:hypothetical protein